jgi:hypothetical protein
MSIVTTQLVEATEQQLVDRCIAALSTSDWVVGKCANILGFPKATHGVHLR